MKKILTIALATTLSLPLMATENKIENTQLTSIKSEVSDSRVQDKRGKRIHEMSDQEVFKLFEGKLQKNVDNAIQELTDFRNLDYNGKKEYLDKFEQDRNKKSKKKYHHKLKNKPDHAEKAGVNNLKEKHSNHMAKNMRHQLSNEERAFFLEKMLNKKIELTDDADKKAELQKKLDDFKALSPEEKDKFFDIKKEENIKHH